MHADCKPLLIVAASGRALAQAARRAGWSPWIIDAFADEDTRDAGPCLRARLGAHGLDPASVRACLDAVPRGLPILYGGGLEGAPQILDALAGHGRLQGNPAAVLRTAGKPEDFFALLAAHGIPYPQTQRARPAAADGWLRKRAGASGGGHVCPGAPAAAEPAHYYQRLIPGRPMSVLFLADGTDARLLGCSALWADASDPGRPFRYAGAVSHAPLPPAQAHQLAQWAGTLTRALGLRGLNGLDLIATVDGPVVLELNPRLTATVELYDPEVRGGLIALHLDACAGRLPRRIHWQRRRVRAQRVIYARDVLQVPAQTPWPVWVSDRPAGGEAIGPGEPVCTVHAAAGDAATARRLARVRSSAIGSLLLQRRQSA